MLTNSYWFLPTLFLLFVFAVIALFFLQRLQHRTSLAVTTLLLTLLALANISLPFSHDTLFNVVGVIHYAFYFALGYFVSSFGLMRFLDKGKTVFLVFQFTLAVSIIALRVNKSPLWIYSCRWMVFLCLLLWRAYTQNMSFISSITSLLLLILSIFIHGIFQH